MLTNKKTDLVVTTTRGAEFRDDYADNVFQTFRIDAHHIGETLTDEIGCWGNNTPILIEAQTGAGKSSFVFEKIIPRATALKGNVLLLSNRVGIASQQKHRLLQEREDPLEMELTELGIQKMSRFSNVAIMTYHSLRGFLTAPQNRDWLQRVKFVVADEAHFFAADALFNAYSSYCLYLITRRFKPAVRIYMTATSWDIAGLITAAEKHNYPSLVDKAINGYVPPLNPIRYQYLRDYSCYDLHFFEALDELKPLIDGKPDEKWLVFCDSKAHGMEFMESLGKGKAIYLDADSKQGKAWEELIRNEQFPCQTLVSTSVLDCGVSIHDSKLVNIAICADNRSTMMQMVGRKRLQPGERVCVYVMEPNRKTLTYRRTKLQEKIDVLNEYANSNEEQRQRLMGRLWDQHNYEIMQLFSSSRGMLYCNDAALFIATKQLQFYDRILNGETSFRNEVYRWFDRSEMMERQCPFTSVGDYFACYREKTFDETAFATLRKLIINDYRKAGFTEPQPSRLDDLGVAALNNRLTSMKSPYRISKAPDGYSLQMSKGKEEASHG